MKESRSSQSTASAGGGGGDARKQKAQNSDQAIEEIEEDAIGENGVRSKLNSEFVDYVRGIVTKNGSSTLNLISKARKDSSYQGAPGDATLSRDGTAAMKYRRRKLQIDDSVEDISLSISQSVKQSRAQKERIKELKHQSLKDNYRGLTQSKAH